MTNICSEIALHTDESHSFVCCLSSVNLAKYDEWKDTDLIYTAIWFLDGVLEEFIQKAENMRGFEIQFVLHKKVEHWDWVYWGGILIYNKGVFPLRDYLLNLRQERYFHK